MRHLYAIVATFSEFAGTFMADPCIEFEFGRFAMGLQLRGLTTGVNFPRNFQRALAAKLYVGSEKSKQVQKLYSRLLSVWRVFAMSQTSRTARAPNVRCYGTQ